MTKQLDTVTTQLTTVQSIVATLPTSSALDSKLSLINASLPDLSQRVNAAPPSPPGPTSALSSPDWCGYTSCGPTPCPHTSCPHPNVSSNTMGFDLDIPRYDPD